jgi:hypothetical protein
MRLYALRRNPIILADPTTTIPRRWLFLCFAEAAAVGRHVVYRSGAVPVLPTAMHW